MGAGNAPFSENKVQRWARRFDGLRSRYATMTSPPTVTMGGSTSTINGKTSGAVSIAWSDARLVTAGTTLAAGSLGGKATHITLADGSVTGSNALVRTRFLTDAPKFEAVFRGTQLGYLGAVVDGQYVARSQLVVFPNSGNACNVLFDFGADTTAYGLRQASKSAGGSGYVVGDTITLAGGTGTAAVLTVIQVATGAVSLVDVSTPGSYSAIPTGTISQASTSGVGTGATFVSPVWEATHTTRKLRRVELLWHGGATQFIGLNVAAFDSVQAWPLPTQVPKLVVCGDSITVGTYLDYPGGHMAASMAQHLALWDNLAINALGGTGWVTVNTTVTPNDPMWSDAKRVADFIAHAGDIYVFMGSQNDGTNYAAVTAAVTSVIDQIQAAVPGAYVIGTGPWVVPNASAQPLSDALSAGYGAARNQSRIRYVDNIAAGWLTGNSGGATIEATLGNKDYWLASDGNHPHQAGLDYLAPIAAAGIADKILAMAA